MSKAEPLLATHRASSYPSLSGLARYVWALLPMGGTLPAEVWHRRHRFLLGLTWFHALLIALIGPILGYSSELSLQAFFQDRTILHGFTEAVPVAFFAALATWVARSRFLQATLVGLGLMTASGVLVHLSGGYIELHFHFFVMLAFLALYQDWLPYLLAIVYVAVHHGIVGVIWPEEVYNHAAAINAPWTWAGIHAFFVLWTAVASIIAWRFNEKAFARTKLILSSAGEGIFGLDLQGKITFINPAATRMMGVREEEVIGKPVESVQRNSGGAAPQLFNFPSPHEHAVASRGSGFMLNQETGEAFLADFISTPIIERGTPAGLVITFSDATKHYEAEQAVAKQVEELARANGEVQARLQELEALHQISRTILDSLDVKAMMEGLLRQILEIGGLDVGMICFVASGDVLEPIAAEGFSDYGNVTRFHKQMRRGSTAGIGERVLATKQIQIVDLDKIDGARTFRRERVRSLVVVPLQTHQDALGVMYLGSRQPIELNLAHLRLFEAIGAQAGIAFQKVRLFEAAERRAHEQEALNSIAAAVSESLRRDDLLMIAIDKVLEVTGRERVSIRLKNPVTGEIRLVAHQGFSPREIEDLKKITRHEATERIFATGEPLVVNDRQELSNTQFLLPQSRSVAWIPIKAGLQVVGVLGVSASSAVPFSDHEVETLQSIANVIGVALENARLFDQTERSLEQIRVLHEIGTATTSTLDLHDVLSAFLRKIDQVLPYAASSVRLYNPATGLLEPVACRHLDEREWRSEHSHGRLGLPSIVFKTKAPVVVRDVETDPRLRDVGFFRKHGLASYLGVPFTIRGEVLGVLSFYTKEQREFGSEEVEFLSTLASQVGIAVHNAQLYQQTQAAGRAVEGANKRLEKLLQDQSRLYAALTPLASAGTVGQMLDRITERLAEATDADGTLVRLYDGADGDFVCAAQRGFPQEYLDGTRTKSPGSAVGTVFETGRPIIVADIATDERVKAKVQLKAGFRSCAFLPLKVADEVRGIVHLASRRMGHFTEDQQDHLMAIVRQMGIAIENRELFDELTRSKGELEKSNEAKDEFLTVMARQKEELSRLNAGLETEIAERSRAKAEIAAKNRDLETLLYVTSHDLREPLRGIENFSRIVHDRYKNVLDEKGQDFLRRVILGAQRLNRLLDDILVLSRSQRMGTPTEEVDGESIVVEAVKRLEGKIAATKASIQVANDFDGLRVDKTWATQAVYNLIVNALKFTRDGEPPDVEIAPYRPEGPGSKVTGVVVRDRGPGVAPEHVERIFQLFQRAVGREVEGTGAGLAIVRQIAERHGGTAWVKPREGGGSEFTITFYQNPDMEGEQRA